MRKYISIIMSLPFLFFISCTERIDLKLDTTFARLVVDGAITTDTTAHKVVLSKTADYFSNEAAPMISGAIVVITDGTNQFPLTESIIYPGVYLTDSSVYGVPGRTYSLLIRNVDVNNDEVEDFYTASSELKASGPLDSIMIFKEETGREIFWFINLFAWEPPTVDYYSFKAWKNGVLVKDTVDEFFLSDDILFNGNYLYGLSVQMFFGNNGEKVFVGDSIVLELNSITKEYYKYITELQSEVGYKNPLFGSPSANISTNVSGGAMGFFTAYSIQRVGALYYGF